MVKFFEGNGQAFISKRQKDLSEKHSVRFRMIRKDESSRYLESLPIWLPGHYTTM